MADNDRRWQALTNSVINHDVPARAQPTGWRAQIKALKAEVQRLEGELAAQRAHAQTRCPRCDTSHHQQA